ncbi:MAG TPA: VOC family protein [Actinocrinis sp.]|nr:VOC family protein [Actinocrinis sp.]
MTLRIQCLDIDCFDPSAVADFWQEALGWRRTHEDPDEIVLEPPAGSPQDGVAPDLLFLRVPDPTPVLRFACPGAGGVISQRHVGLARRALGSTTSITSITDHLDHLDHFASA